MDLRQEFVTPADGTKRPRAKVYLRDRARELRIAGKTYPEIAEALGVSKSTVSLWVRDLPHPRPDYSDRPQCTAPFLARLSATRRAQTELTRREQKARAEEAIGELSERELLLVGAALYWAEGSKDKPWRRAEQVKLINSDPDVIRVFLRWLDSIGVAPEDRTFRLTIHESADVPRSLAFWADTVGVDPADFLKTTLKRANANPRRRNLGDNYHGCLVVRVKRSTVLYRQIDGWWRGIARASWRPTEIP